LLTKITDNGHMTLTEQTFTIVKDGEKHKKTIDSMEYKELAAN